MDLSNAFFSYRGRFRRRDFWLYSVFLWLISSAFVALFGGDDHGINLLRPYRFDGVGLIGFVAWLGVLYATFAVQVKRWHDRNKSGWWALITLVPLIGWLWVLIECGFLEGTSGDNRYGAATKL
ncbi:MAG: DUF805 domain-containing protein [Asticcacaulis sp.]|uniref:DUF805 domain-containing protein n=1 Tax=Asticcacaulis sp. TaxID=1872648 RepID=UPI0025B8772B|nr:DUF805 domain-containing protein [Asticcacaulis sp.]MCA1933817.1 DUF805 domain-containing protein [Asticcacaulis sp.]